MTAIGRPPRLAPRAWIVLILLAAAGLRLVALGDVPPGMTHDEADHGLTALSILDGARALYFPIGYGREPLYDYATAVVTRATGPTILAARLTSVYFSLLLIAAVYAWARRAFGAPVALLTAAGLAGGFWPLMTARQALRSGALPAVWALAVLFFWVGVFPRARGSRGAGGQRDTEPSPQPSPKGRGGSPPLPRSSAPLLFFSGLLLGLSFYIYLPARVLWLALPLLVVYLWLWDGLATRATRGVIVTLLAATAVAAPLLLYLAARPELEVRVGELSAPLRAAGGGDFGPLWANATAALRLFTIEGDQTWRYNIPGRPLLPWPLGWLFYAGLLVAGWMVIAGLKKRETTDYADYADLRPPRSAKSAKSAVSFSAPGAFLALVWLALGFAPVLVTGPGLATTQAIGALPVVYVFPALALVAGYRAIRNYELGIRKEERISSRKDAKLAKLRKILSLANFASLREPSSSPATRHWPLATFLVVVLYVAVAAGTARAYFGQWANSPEVRVQYETTMVTALRYLDAGDGGAAAVSTITPGPFHTPAVAALTLHNPTVRPRWFDGRESLLLPDEPGVTLVIPGFTPIPPALQPYLAGAALVDELPMRPDDLDRPIRVYSLDGPAAIAAARARLATVGGDTPAAFGESIELLGYELSATASATTAPATAAAATARPGETVTLVTAWRLRQSLPGAALFAHVIGPAGLVAQADSLGAPGESWVAGDVLLQLHTFTVPADAAPGEYPLAVGVYTRPDGARLRLPDGGDSVTLTTLTIAAPESDE